MVAKTKLGSDFVGALTYGAKQRPRQDARESTLLSTHNLVPGTTHQLARQMQEVASFNTRCHKAVWHTSLSWPPGEVVTAEQKQQAAERYCELMGASLAQHQIVVYEHTDTAHAHLHVYINRVPIDGGTALADKNNFYRQTKVCRQISEELGLQPVMPRRQSSKALDPARTDAQRQVAHFIQQLLQDPSRPVGNVAGVEWLSARLAEASITSRLKLDAQGQLVAASFGFKDKNMKGSEIGFKAAELRHQLQSNPMQLGEQQQQTQQEPVSKPAKRNPRIG